ncbi:hypothetical protein IQ225_02775, partial [Synechocystis salina LEGE 06155]|nr:hypothetical protein [Synechocystis salina LEGE 06155]
MLFYHRLKNWLRKGLIIFLLNLVMVVATADLVYPQTVNPTGSQPKGAPVILGDETLFYIQARIASFSPEFRAQVISNRIVSLAKNTEVNLDALKIIDNEAAATIDILAGDETLVTITDVDAVAAGQSRQELANQYLQIIKESITDFRSSYSIHSLVRGVVYTLMATIVLVASLIGITKSVPVIYRQLRRWRGTRIPALRLFDT